MSEALREAERGRVTAPPNPHVGALALDAHGTVIARGYHRRRGEPHAEANALAAVTDSVHTLVCSLEPCHAKGPHASQPECVQAILRARIPHVLVGMLDPDERVAGAGVEALRRAGVQVRVLNDARVLHSLRAYSVHRAQHRAYVLCKAAVSLDGRLALPGGDSRWISCPEARLDAHVLRLESQAVLVGTRTALLDAPQLTVRLPEQHALYAASREHLPLRCFLDARGEVRAGSLLDDAHAVPTRVYTTSRCDVDTLALWRARGLQMHTCACDGQLPLLEVLRDLAARGVLQVLVEGGAALHTALLDAALVDELVLYVAPVLLGDASLPFYTGAAPARVADALRMTLRDVRVVGSNVRLTLVATRHVQ